MDDLKINQLCSFLTKADITCGYIPNEPIVKPRDELIKERIVLYKGMLTELWQELSNREDKLTPEQAFSNLFVAVVLVQGDIETQYISLDPVLYDRDSMIKERILSHYVQLVDLV